MSITAIRTAQTVTDLVGRLATVPGLVRPGISSWDMTTRLPLHPLAWRVPMAIPGCCMTWRSRVRRSRTGSRWR